jgi:hypothetical protein
MDDITLLPNLELEFRLGKIKKNRFDTNIKETSYYKIKALLDKSESCKVLSSEYVDIFYEDVRYNNITNTYIQKKSLHKEDLSNNIYDIRISVSQELPATCKKKETYRRNKKRDQYIFRNWSIDLTIVTLDNNITYECELEYHNINYIRSHDLMFLKKLAIKELNNILVCSNI